MYAEFHASTASPAARHLTPAAQRNGSWPEVLSDLAGLGRVLVETESPTLTLAHRAALPGAGAGASVPALPGHAVAGLGWQYLRADDVTLRLDTGALDSAWVFQRSDLPARRRGSYAVDDGDGRAIAVLSPAPSGGGAEHPVWATLIDALPQ